MTSISADAPRVALLVAGGAGLRMGAPVPKQFLPLAGEPVLLHTLRAFAAAVPETRRVVVLPAAQISYWQQLLTEWEPAPPNAAEVPAHEVVAGGATRLASVRAGLTALATAPAATLVAIHDGVRPLVPVHVIQEAYRVAAISGSAVASVALKDSLRRIVADGTSTAEDRAAFRLVQTPQCFPLETLRRAYAAVQDDDPALTDDASVVERLGHRITLIEGHPANLKITTPDDVVLAEALWKKR